MEQYIKLSVERYNELIKAEKRRFDLQAIFDGNYSFVSWDNEGFSVVSKEEYAKNSRKDFEASMNENISYHARIDRFNSLPWYKRLFKKV